MKGPALIIATLAFLNFPSKADQSPNILLIAIDDLNDYVGCLNGHPDAYTPNIDALAEAGVLFTNAHCNAPVCNPSRASIWSGLRPHTTGITTNHSGWFRDNPKYRDVTTLPEALRQNGYQTAGFGKLFHIGHGNKPWPDWQQSRNYGYGPVLKEHINYAEGDALSDWGVPTKGKKAQRGPQPSDPGMASFDEDIARRAIEFLGDTHDSPFLLGAGFYRPHTPLYARQKWFDHFPLDEITLPEIQENDLDDLPYFQKKPRREQDIEAPGLWDHEWVMKHRKWPELIQAYLASIASADEQVGRVWKALQKSKFADNTYLILFSDHGWDLGEKKHWGKAALWEQTTRVPFIVVGPSIPNGVRCDAPIELINIYPTVCDFAGIESPDHLQGNSLKRLLDDVEADWNHAAMTTFSDHHALRTKRYRYIRYVDGSEELYDHQSDLNEWDNLATDSHSALPELRTMLDTLLKTP